MPGLSVTLIHPQVPIESPFERLGRSHLPPLGLLYLASALEAEGHRVEVLDLNLPGWGWGRAVARVLRRPPQVLGLGTLAPAFDSVARAGRGLRRSLPAETLLVAGGPDVTVRRRLYHQLGCFDALLLGEAEQTLARLCAAYPDVPAGPGVVAPGDDPAAARLPPPVEPDRAPYPARHLLPLRDYRGGPAYKRGRHTTSIFTHRGCPYACTFCEKGVHTGPMRRRSAGSILDEVRRIRRDHDIHDIRFMDDVFLATPALVDRLLERILRDGDRFRWLCTGRVDLLDEARLRRMRRAGCYRVELGLESGSPRVLELINKNTQLEQAARALETCRRAGVESIANFIIGFPTETEQEMLQTLRFSLQVRPDWAIYFSYYPAAGSEMVRRLGLPTEGLAGGSVYDHPAYLVPRRRVQRLVDRAYTEFYFRPGVILRRLAALRSGWLLYDLGRTAAAQLGQRLLGPG